MTRTPRGARARTSGGTLAMPMSTVGAAHIIVAPSLSINSNTLTGSTFRRQTCAPPTAVTIQVNVQPLAWNIGSVHRYRSVIRIGMWSSVPTTFM